MNRNRSSTLFLSFILLAGIAACEKSTPDDVEDQGYSDGIFIVNEGAFGNSNGSVTYFDADSVKLENELFYAVNGRPLGDVVQSMAIHYNRGYMVVNNSQKVEVVDLETFGSVGVIEGLSYPRYFLGINSSRGYVSNGSMDGMVYSVDLGSLKITDSIQVGFGPEQMMMHEGLVYVLNSGGWANDNTISVIDVSQDIVVNTIQVGDNPVSMVFDIDSYLWVLCKGKVVYDSNWSVIEETDSELLRLDVNSGEIISRITLGQAGDFYSPARLSRNPLGNKLLFMEAGGLYQMDIDDTAQPSEPIIDRDFYGLGVDPVSGIIYGLDAVDFNSSGWMYRFFPNGDRLDSLSVGIAPNSVVFN